MGQTPSGSNFLPTISSHQLINLYKHEKDQKAKSRLLAAIHRKEGKTLQEISNIIKRPITTLGDWLRRISNEGIERRFSIKQLGRPTRLNDIQLDELSDVLSLPPTEKNLPFLFWTTKLVREYIRIEYGVEYTTRQITNILRKLEFTSQKPRPSHLKANKILQETFKKTSLKIFDPTWKVDMRSTFWTKVSSP